MYLLIITRPSRTTYITSPVSPSRKITSPGRNFTSRDSEERKLISRLDSFCSANSLRLASRSMRNSGPTSVANTAGAVGGLPVSEKNRVRVSLVWRSFLDRLFQNVQ